MRDVVTAPGQNEVASVPIAGLELKNRDKWLRATAAKKIKVCELLDKPLFGALDHLGPGPPAAAKRLPERVPS